MKTATTGASPPKQQHSPLFHVKKEYPLPQTNSTIANIPWLMGPLVTFWLLLSFLSAGATARGSVHKNKDSFSSYVLSRTGPIPLASGRRAPAPAQNGPSACRHPTQQQPAMTAQPCQAVSPPPPHQTAVFPKQHHPADPPAASSSSSTGAGAGAAGRTTAGAGAAGRGCAAAAGAWAGAGGRGCAAGAGACCGAAAGRMTAGATRGGVE